MKWYALLLAILSAGMLASCAGKPAATASPAATATATTTATTRAAESLPPGDIPDTQTFVTYVSPQDGYSVDAPEGWSRSEHGATVLFASGYDFEFIAIVQGTLAPTTSPGNSTLMTWLHKATPGARNVRILTVNSPAGPTVMLSYTADAAPNAVTGKRIPLGYETHVFYKAGRTAYLTLAAPAGSDNVDQWKRIAQSFHWR